MMAEHTSAAPFLSPSPEQQVMQHQSAPNAAVFASRSDWTPAGSS
jgi:hypothetical protein